MMKTLLITCLLLVLLPPVASLICESCWNQGKDCTDPITEECDESRNQSCMSSIGEGKMSFLESTLVLKSCIDSELCKEVYSSVTISSSVYVQSKTSCCQTDMCNSGPLKVPEFEKRPKNGLKCPSCLNIFSDRCTKYVVVSCRNEEDHCFYYGGRKKIGESIVMGAFRGCATASMCDYANDLLKTDPESLRVEVTKAECSPANETVLDL